METTRLAYSATEVAAALGVSKATVYELTRTGRLDHIKVGSRILIPRHALDKLLTTPAQTDEDIVTDTEEVQENVPR